MNNSEIMNEIRRRSKRVLQETIVSTNSELIMSEPEQKAFDLGVSTAIGVTLEVLKEQDLA